MDSFNKTEEGYVVQTHRKMNSELVNEKQDVTKAKFNTKLALFVTSILIGIIIYNLLNIFETPSSVVRLRNSFISTVGKYPEDFLWDYRNIPNDFLLDNKNSYAYLNDIIKGFSSKYTGNPSTFNNAIILANKLTTNTNYDSYIIKDIRSTYNIIIDEGRGDCSDYIFVFNAVAAADGMIVRKWGMSFNGFGSGHTFSEIYDINLNKWVFIDVFNSIYVVDEITQTPLSVLEFQKYLRSGDGKKGYIIKQINPNKFGFENTDHAKRYYINGSDQFYLWWGINNFQYNEILLKVSEYIKDGNYFHRAATQLLAILSGKYPDIKILQTETNKKYIDDLFKLKRDFIFLVSTFLISLLIFIVLLRRLSILIRK